MGKGRFLQLAQRYPEINFIGIEKYTSVLLRAIQKLEKMEDSQKPYNLRFLCIDAENLPDIFAPEEIDKIFLNFSDPWPKKRHERRRLTSRYFLNRYEKILKKMEHLNLRQITVCFLNFPWESFQKHIGT